MNILVKIIVANTIISLISLTGVFALSFKNLNKKSVTGLLVSFAAGVLLATAVLNILPEALEGLPITTGLVWFMYGIICAFLLERFLLWYHHHHEDTHDINPTATLILIGDGIHNFIDGLAIAAAFVVNPVLGLTTTFAVAAHEIPQEIADYSILRHCGMSKQKALTWNLISALTAVVGGIVGFYLFKESFELVYFALALTAGIFLYVAAADLIPELHNHRTSNDWFPQTLLFIVGVVLVMAIITLAPHSHEGEHNGAEHHELEEHELEDEHIGVEHEEHELEHHEEDINVHQ
jgi:zinc and cadmium transporter